MIFDFKEPKTFRTKSNEIIISLECKEVRYVILKNDGTTVIRYQWLRSPPNAAMRKLLANPGSSLQQSFGSNTIENFDCDRFPKEFDEHRKLFIHLKML